MKMKCFKDWGENMKKGIVVYSSISVVHRARKLMRQLAETQVVQLPSDLGLKGCSYGLECAFADLHTILRVSKEKNLKIKAVFEASETENGRVYERYDLS